MVGKQLPYCPPAAYNFHSQYSNGMKRNKNMSLTHKSYFKTCKSLKVTFHYQHTPHTAYIKKKINSHQNYSIPNKLLSNQNMNYVVIYWVMIQCSLVGSQSFRRKHWLSFQTEKNTEKEASYVV
jgi:hypothetical protein